MKGFLHFQTCLQQNNIPGGNQVDHMLSEEKTKPILPASQYRCVFKNNAFFLSPTSVLLNFLMN